MCVKFQLSSSNSFRDIRGFHIYTRGAVPPACPWRRNWTSDARVDLLWDQRQ